MVKSRANQSSLAAQLEKAQKKYDDLKRQQADGVLNVLVKACHNEYADADLMERLVNVTDQEMFAVFEANSISRSNRTIGTLARLLNHPKADLRAIHPKQNQMEGSSKRTRRQPASADSAPTSESDEVAAEYQDSQTEPYPFVQ